MSSACARALGGRWAVASLLITILAHQAPTSFNNVLCLCCAIVTCVLDGQVISWICEALYGTNFCQLAYQQVKYLPEYVGHNLRQRHRHRVGRCIFDGRHYSVIGIIGVHVWRPE
jgi:hypothetical protein